MNPEDLRKCTVRISLREQGKHEGTGFFVTPDLVLTCAHVVKNAQNNSVYINGRQRDIVSVRGDIDLAIVRGEIEADSGGIGQLDDSINLGDELYIFGYPETCPYGDSVTLEYEGESVTESGELLKLKEGQISPGFSGSPVLNLRTGGICGIIIKTRDRNIALGGRAISTSRIWEIFPELQPPKLEVNPFYPTSGGIQEIGKVFGREKLLRDIFETLKSGSSVALLGERSIGKSSLLWAIYHHSEVQLKRKPIYLNLGNIFGDKEFYEALCEEIGINPIVTGNNFYRKVKQYKLLLLLDETENLTWKGFTKPVRGQIRSLANDGDPPFRLVVASCHPLTEVFADSKQDSPFEGICQSIEVKGWEEKIIREFIQVRLLGNSVKFTEEEIREIIQKSGGHPQKVMLECWQKYRNRSLSGLTQHRYS